MDTFTRDGLRFDVMDQGPTDGPPVILLHGFPASPRSWERVTPGLVDAGHRVLVPAQRGYSPGARPPRRRDYRLDELTADIVALADQAGLERFAVAGHDWGSAVAWAVAGRHPARVTSLTALSVPHPRAFVEALAGTQVARSWYMAFFQLPQLPERVMGSDLAVQMLLRSGLDEELARAYVADLRDPAARRGAINWYRAIPLSWSGVEAVGAIEVPTLFLWGSADRFVGRSGVERTGNWVRAPYRLEIVEGGSHWLPEMHAGRVTPLLAGHLATHR